MLRQTKAEGPELGRHRVDALEERMAVLYEREVDRLLAAGDKPGGAGGGGGGGPVAGGSGQAAPLRVAKGRPGNDAPESMKSCKTAGGIL